MSMLVAPSGAKPVITVNYGSNLNNNGGGQPSTAASWVQYANVTNNYGIKYWEIGNEIVGNGYFGTSLDWEYDLHDLDQTPANRVGNPALSPTAYGTNAAAFIKAMKAVDPTIKCGIGVFWQSWLTTYDRDVLTAISNALQGSGYTLDFVIYHWYPGGHECADSGGSVGHTRSGRPVSLGHPELLHAQQREPAAVWHHGIGLGSGKWSFRVSVCGGRVSDMVRVRRCERGLPGTAQPRVRRFVEQYATRALVWGAVCIDDRAGG